MRRLRGASGNILVRPVMADARRQQVQRQPGCVYAGSVGGVPGQDPGDVAKLVGVVFDLVERVVEEI